VGAAERRVAGGQVAQNDCEWLDGEWREEMGRQLRGDLPLRLQKREGSRSLPFAPLAGGHV